MLQPGAMTTPRPRLEDLIALALEAGRVIMEMRDAGCEAMDKAERALPVPVHVAKCLRGG